jgi:hypothetical protein
MDIEVVDFETHPTKTQLACILVRYEKLMLRCELVYHVGAKKAWVRMPEIWKTQTFKKKYAYWPTKELSDEFQEAVLKIIFEKYDLNIEKLAILHEKMTNKRGSCRNV